MTTSCIIDRLLPFSGHRVGGFNVMIDIVLTRSFDVLFDLHLSKRLSKRSRRRWFEMSLRSLWRHCNEVHDRGSCEEVLYVTDEPQHQSVLFEFCKTHLLFSNMCFVLSLTHWSRDKMANISQTTFPNSFSWMKMWETSLRFHWNLFPRFQLMIFQDCFRWWPRLETHPCVTRTQWLKCFMRHPVSGFLHENGN